jgi:Cd2+/Zn2+-exporting ATPase
MSTPVAIAAGIGKSGRSGVLIKGGIHLENLGKIRVVAFDKTGTLTKGEPIVTDILAKNGDETDVIRLAYSLERLSEHPLAKAIAERAEKMEIEALNVDNFACLIGSGVSANVGGQKFYAGKPEFFEDMGLKIHDNVDIDRIRGQGKTAILIGNSEGIEGIIGIRDEIRPNAKDVIRELHKMGIKAIMLTGDSEIVAGAI